MHLKMLSSDVNAYVKDLSRHTVWTHLRLLKEQSDLGPHCFLQRHFEMD